MKVCFERSKYLSRVSFFSSLMRLLKHSSCLLSQLNFVDDLVSSLNLADFFAKSGMKLALDYIMHRKLITSSLDSGFVKWFSASTFFGSGFTPSLPNNIPQNSISESPK